MINGHPPQGPQSTFTPFIGFPQVGDAEKGIQELLARPRKSRGSFSQLFKANRPGKPFDFPNLVHI